MPVLYLPNQSILSQQGHEGKCPKPYWWERLLRPHIHSFTLFLSKPSGLMLTAKRLVLPSIASCVHSHKPSHMPLPQNYWSSIFFSFAPSRLWSNCWRPLSQCKRPWKLYFPSFVQIKPSSVQFVVLHGREFLFTTIFKRFPKCSCSAIVIYFFYFANSPVSGDFHSFFNWLWRSASPLPWGHSGGKSWVLRRVEPFVHVIYLHCLDPLRPNTGFWFHHSVDCWCSLLLLNLMYLKIPRSWQKVMVT